MSRRSMIAIGAAALVAVLAFGGWYVFLRDDAPPPVSLDAAVEQATSTTEAAAGTSAAPTTADAAAIEDEMSGEWTVVAGDSFVGYRVQEELSGIGAAEAVGRTSQVAGSLRLDGSQVTAISIEVDMMSLVSDSNQRDNQLRSRGLQTDDFPTASFVLAEPMDLGGEPVVGEAVAAVAVGDLTLHGVTCRVEIPVEAEVVGERSIVAVGSVELLITDYDIEAPVGFRVLSINETGTIEMQLVFAR